MPQTAIMHMGITPSCRLIGGYKRFEEHTASTFMVEVSFNHIFIHGAGGNIFF
jgi:hypothetical protein